MLNKKGITSIVLATAIISQSGSLVYAANSEGILIGIESNDNGKYTIQSETEKGNITVTESNGIRTVTMTDSNSSKVEKIIYNQNQKTLYSSLTGETIDLTNDEGIKDENNSASARSISSYETKYISYATIKKIVGNVATAVSVTGAILSLIPQTKAIGGAASCIATIVKTLNTITPASSKHGIKLKIKVTKYYRTRAGQRRLYKTTKTIESGTLY